MADKDTEEKRFPASAKKLKDARKRGQVASSRDLLSAVSFIAVLGLFYFFRGWFYARFMELIEIVALAGSQPFELLARQAMMMVFWLFLTMMGSALAIMLLSLIPTAIIMMKGLIFSFEPVKPQFSQLSPVTGFKRLASLRNLIEFIKGITKVALLSSIFIAIGASWLSPIFQAPVCAPGCLAPVAFGALVAFAVTGALSFVLLGLADIPVQRWLFGRDMKMTRSEYKREHRDIEGDPYIRREFNRLRQEAVSTPYQSAKAGPTLIFSGNTRAIAIRFVKDETPMPMIAGKATDEDALRLEEAARRMQIPVIEDIGLVEAMFDRSTLGQYVHSDFFPLVVPHLVALNHV
ncbi:EscU/YscU/HrcU family type III secretion system export apparatus switch protein [Ochrobactrum vermis]|uniref:EscU/YscU/HrcU family type III secretion system export apparatus switch protein n=1 Tax=Ochrobactrum vermis TaxID=1827297 RepID=A0ABU8PJ69_9HYPH|nr:EscU/YscU/HrcU family type III secretion system export apparatus switch protein [Ochrobactrum vermis]PQZ25845.1 translocation protein in type III secretion system, RhcU [Ochrobactrum vermis]